MILGLTGRRDDDSSAGAGKDTVADILVREHGLVKIAFADELKRIAQRLYGFTDEQLWGPSETRSVPDLRYPRKHGPWLHAFVGDEPRLKCQCCGFGVAVDEVEPEVFAPVVAHDAPQCYLTPRFVLQILGTECGRTLYEDTWVRLALDAAAKVLTGKYVYGPQTGLHEFQLGRRTLYSADVIVRPARGVVIPDVRWPAGNEGRAIREAGGQLWLIHRPGVGGGGTHASETQKASSVLFDYQIWNNGSLIDLAVSVRGAMEGVQLGG